MSNDTSADNRLPLGSVRAASLTVRKGTLLVRAVSFWTAVVLPFLYLPLLFGGLEGNATLFGGLLVLNAVALFLGHDYRGSDAAESPQIRGDP